MLNHSCTRCRQKKLKCNGQLPCTNCTKKSLHDECKHITRKVRPRKSDRIHSDSTTTTIQQSSFTASESPMSSFNLTPPTYDSPTSPTHHQTLRMLAREALGDANICADLIRKMYYWKVAHLIHASIDLKTVLQNIDLLFDEDSPCVEADEIVVCMMIVALSLQYLPKKNTPLNLIERLAILNPSINPRLRQKLLFELSQNYIHHQMMNQSQHSYAHIQSITLLLIYDQSGDAFKGQLYDHAIRASQQLGLHIIESNDESVQNELMVRTWWYLVARNWFASLSSSFYSIHPHQFSTRLPVENAYLDLPPESTHQSRSDLSSVYVCCRYSFTLIKLADMIRRLVDFRLTESNDDFTLLVQEAFEDFEEQLPIRYSLATIDPPEADDMDVNRFVIRNKLERWMLHQLLFHSYLELHHFETSKPIPESCISLANHIIEIQGKVSKSCFVLDSLHVNVSNVIKAASVLVVDLMQAGNSSSIVRSLRLRKIKLALTRCQEQGLAKEQEFIQVKGMLDLEDKLWRQSRPASFSSSSSSSTQSSPLSFDMYKTGIKSIAPSPLESLPTPPSGNEVTMQSYLPSDAALYPIFAADSNNTEWSRLYESFLDLSSIK